MYKVVVLQVTEVLSIRSSMGRQGGAIVRARNMYTFIGFVVSFWEKKSHVDWAIFSLLDGGMTHSGELTNIDKALEEHNTYTYVQLSWTSYDRDWMCKNWEDYGVTQEHAIVQIKIISSHVNQITMIGFNRPV